MAFQFVIVLVLLLVIENQSRSSRSTSTITIMKAKIPCAGLVSALSVPNLMRSILRKARHIAAMGSLVFFLSCERHHVGELPDEQATTETKAPAPEREMKSDQPAGTTHHHMAPTPEPRNSPANFFPDKPKP